MKIKKEIREIIFNIGILLLVFIFVNILTTTIFQIINIKMSSINIIIATIATIGVFLFIKKDKLKREDAIVYIISIVITFIFSIICIYCMGKIFDTSCDGNFYHKTAIGLIKKGWNPMYMSSEEFCKESDPEIENKGQFLWIDHYPKATWNFAASIYSITDNIESGKAITILLVTSLACITYYYLSNRYLKDWQAVLISLAISINPIVMSQLFTYYVDGIMGILIYGTILFLLMISDRKFEMISNKEKWVGLAAEIILCMNIKFTGIYFAAIFSIIFYTVWLIQSTREKKIKEDFIKLTMNFAVIVILGIVVVGASTYVKNLVEHRNPVYPIIGKDKVDIITTMQPASFSQKNRITKLFESIFSNSENITYSSGKSPSLKIPFSIEKGEFNNLAIPDTRIGGYGIFFSGILVVSIILLIYKMIELVKYNKEIFKNIITILIGILITTLFMAEAWWARYSPQLYLIPILAIFCLFYDENQNKNIKKKIITDICGIILYLLMIINIYTFSYWRVKDINISRNINEGLNNLNEESVINNGVEISFNNTNYYGIIFNIRDYKIKYSISSDKKDKEHYLYNYQILF